MKQLKLGVAAHEECHDDEFVGYSAQRISLFPKSNSKEDVEESSEEGEDCENEMPKRPSLF